MYKGLRIRAIRKAPYDLDRLARALLELAESLAEDTAAQKETKPPLRSEK